MITLDQVLDIVMGLPHEQQKMLLKIVQRRLIEERRREIAVDAQESLGAFRAGVYKPQTGEQVIVDLRAK